MEIIPVTSQYDLMRFIKFPHKLYKGDENWVPKLITDEKKFFNPKKNPYYAHSDVMLFIAMAKDKIVGRISAHTNTLHNKVHHDKVGFFGFFESINDQDVANKLFDTAGNWLRTKGCNAMRGPMNFSTNDECGLLIKGFDTPSMVMMPYNKKYYQSLIENAGLDKEMDLFAYIGKVQPAPDRIKKLSDKLEKRGRFTIRSLNKKNRKTFKKDIETIFEIYTKAWENNWGAVPMTNLEFKHIVSELMPIVVPELVFIAEIDGEPAGFSMTLPDYNFILKKMNGHLFPFGLLKALYYKNKIPRLRVITMGVIKKFQGRGIDTVFYAKSFEVANKRGYKEGELSWILENNDMMNKIAKSLNAELYKTYRIFEDKL